MIGQQQARRLGRRAVLQTAGGAVAGAVAATTAGAAAQAGSGTSASVGAGAGIVGAWRITATITSPEGFPPLTFFSNFFADGNHVQGASSPLDGVGHGVWQQTGERSYALTVLEFSFPETADDPTIIFTVRARIELDASGTSFTALFRFDGTLPTGEVVLQGGEGVARATRIQPLPF